MTRSSQVGHSSFTYAESLAMAKAKGTDVSTLAFLRAVQVLNKRIENETDAKKVEELEAKLTSIKSLYAEWEKSLALDAKVVSAFDGIIDVDQVVHYVKVTSQKEAIDLSALRM